MKIVKIIMLCAVVILLSAGRSIAADTISKGHAHEHGKVEAAVAYSCPSHPSETSKTLVKCPKCGMMMTKAEARHSYRCPMHPDVISDKPGTCSKCKMALEETDIPPAKWKNP